MAKARKRKQTSGSLLWVGLVGLATGLGGIAALVGNYDAVCGFIDSRFGTKTCFVPDPKLHLTSFAKDGVPTPGNVHALKAPPQKFRDSVAFQGGAKLTTTLSNLGDTDHIVTVSRIGLLVEFTSPNEAQLNYKQSDVVGKGISEALFYRVELDGETIRAAKVNSADPVQKSIDVRNLFENQITLKGKGDSQVLKLELIPRKNGLYKLQVDVDWSSGGEVKNTQGDVVYLYFWET